jgi:UDP-N-acetylglucosamine--N-acetylmuramyl-(pentapeptide) pyrophosphoryl-undecaprenol N-acetylglucosamine transferase
MDRTLVEKSGLTDGFYGIPSGKLRRYFSLRIIPDCVKIIAGLIKSIALLSRIKPRALFSKGGYVSVPPCLGAKILGIPVYTHECDLSPGLATRLNARWAARIFVSYPKTADFFPPSRRSRVMVTGNPVRKEFYTASPPRGRAFLGLGEPSAGDKPLLLVLGGSSGSRQINHLVRETLPWLTEHFTVVHQTGAGEDAPPETPSGAGYRPYPFIYAEMPDVIAAADVVLARAGANTLSECAVCGKPLVLVPLSGAGTRGDQVENAAFFADQGAALVIDGRTASPEDLAAAMETMLDPAAREGFSKRVRALLPQIPAADMIARIIKEDL